MKNLVYTICDNTIKNFSEFFVQSVRKYNDVDICCISPPGVKIDNTLTFITDQYTLSGAVELGFNGSAFEVNYVIMPANGTQG